MKRLFATAMLCILANPAFADDTTLNNGMYGPEPLNVKAGVESPVRMVSEDLEIHFAEKRTSVAVVFHFLNPTAAAIHATIGFPDEGLAQKAFEPKDAEGIGFPIENMKSFANGKEVASKVEFGYVQWAPDRVCWLPGTKADGDPMAWHTLAIDFPPGREVIVERRYATKNSYRNGGPYFYDYTVHTGSAWKGNIGRLRATVFLEGGLSVDELGWIRKKVPPDINVKPDRPEWKILSSRKMVLEWDNFKPSNEKGKQYIRIATLDEE